MIARNVAVFKDKCRDVKRVKDIVAEGKKEKDTSLWFMVRMLKEDGDESCEEENA